MKLCSLRVEHLRQFRQPLQVRDLGPGINVFTGPNESGKSTLVRAIRAAFFERHKSNSVDDLQPWGDSSAAPSVQLEFDWQGARWKLSKSFLKHKRCDLDIAGQRLNGDEAEEKLAELLGYQLPGRGASKAEHWGIPGLLWIEQGCGQDIREPLGYASGYLKSVLGASLGEVASSAGDEIIAQVERQRAVLLTATGRPTGDYADIQRRYIDTEAQLREADAAIATYRQQVDRLGELRRQQEEDAPRPWEAYRQQALQARERLAEVRGWQQAQQQEEKDLQHCTGNQRLCREQLASFARQQEDLALRAAELKKAEQALGDRQAQRSAIEARQVAAQAAYHQADETLKLARRHARRAALAGELAQADRELSGLDDKLNQARTLQAELLGWQGQLQANPLDAAALKRLRAQSQRLGELEIAQQAVATRLQFELLPAQHIRLGEEDLVGQGQRLLLEPVDINIPGTGRLRIQPGGEDIADLARRRQAAQDGFAALLGEFRVDSLAQAEERAEQRRALQEDIRRGELQLGHSAPKGVDELHNQQALLRQRRQAIEQELAGLPEPDANTIDAATAELALEQAREQLKNAEQAASRYETEHSLALQAVHNAQAEWQRLQDSVQAPGRQQQEKEIADRLIDLQAREGTLRRSMDLRRQQIEAANPDILDQDIKRFSGTADALEDAARRRALELAGLQSKLEALGANDLEERRAELARQFEYMGRRRGELDQRAAALQLLLDLLRAKRQALTRRIQAPLQRHLNHYLQLLFPQARLSVNEDLLPQQLVRAIDGHEEHGDFDALSFGAREQMGLISRLAYADLLKEAGRPTLIILDDALVHSDPPRLAQMKRILFDAAQRHQILLFTCHPDNWRDLGVAPISMQSLQAAD
ncbi:AAA family ATPase [Candidimonas nitroreducens]|uniref:GTP-binding protein n=1 Tax=Candidimonas nitroreducens TaxID=683354 RepID=A0A225M4Y7_9BURK|nr:AAA family ATPase [Candidimonas nitroreducens]OWT56186.1 GTP-binding protein [Candidimonas nitroreducens]